MPEEDEPRAYRQQPFHKRIIVASAGSAMHFLIAFVLALIVVVGVGQTTNNIQGERPRAVAREDDPGRRSPA